MHFIKPKSGKIWAAVSLAGMAGLALLAWHRFGISQGGARLESSANVPSEVRDADEVVVKVSGSSMVNAVPAGDEAIHLPDAADSDEAFLKWARDAVSRSAERAIALAESQNDDVVRARLIAAVLQAWGEMNPRAALDWALVRDENERFVRVEAVLRGGIAQPATMLELGREWLAEGSETGTAYATALVGALSAKGDFETALQLAKEGPADSRADWLANVFQRWPAANPEGAVKALEELLDGKMRDAAIHALATGWPAQSASSLAQMALGMPQGEGRTFALSSALDKWCLNDPVGMAEWMNQIEPSRETDFAIAALVTRTDSLERSPEVALGWAESINDGQIRSDALKHVLKEWSRTNQAAAQGYILKSGSIPAEQRGEFLQAVALSSQGLDGPE
jgi:hypothetical protein